MVDNADFFKYCIERVVKMRKSISKRILSSITAALTAVMLVPNSLPDSMAAGEYQDLSEAPRVFDLDENALKQNWMKKSAHDLYTEIDFENADGTPASVTTPDNTYYLLVHATGDDKDSQFRYGDGESREHYKLIEIEANGTSWSSGKLDSEDFVPTKDFWGNRVYPYSSHFEGILLKNEDPSSELTVDEAKSLTGCTPTDTIEGLTVIKESTLNKRTSSEPNAEYGNDTVVMKAAPAYVVDLNVYELDGETRSFIDDPSYNYYMLTYLVPKGSGKSRANAQAWSMKQVTPDAANHQTVEWDESTKYFS